MSENTNTRPEAPGRLQPNALGVAGIVFLVLAAVAPLTGIVVVASLAIALGNGGGTPVSFLIVAIVTGAILNFSIVAGSDAVVINLLPLLLVVAIVGGIAFGGYLRTRKPTVYAGLSDDLEKFNGLGSPSPDAVGSKP